MFGVGKRHLKGYLVPLGVCLVLLLVAVVLLDTISVSTAIVLYFVLPFAFLLLVITYHFFKDKLQGSNKPRRKAVKRSSYSIPEDEIIPIQSDDSGWAGKIFLGYVLIATFVLLPLCLIMAWRGLDFASQFAWICFLGSIGFLFLLLIGIGVNNFIKGQYVEHSYRDDHNPHLREWKEKLRERK